MSETYTYYVIKPTTHQRKKVSYGDALELSEAQARPLRHGGFITPDKAAAQRIAELVSKREHVAVASPDSSGEEGKA